MPNKPAAAVPTGPASPIARLAGHTGGVTALAFSPDRGLLASGGRDGTAKLWDIGSGTPGERASFGPPGRRLQSLTFSRNGNLMAAGSGALDGTVWVFDVSGSAPRETVALRGARGAVNAIAFSPDGSLLAGAGEDRSLRIWEPNSNSRGEARANLPGHTAPVRALAFSPDSQFVATGADDSTVRLWTVSRIRSTERAVLSHPTGVVALTYTSDGYTLITGGRDGVIRLMDPGSARPGPRGDLPSQSAGIRLLVVTADGKTMVSVADGPRVVHWDLAAGRPVREWGLPTVQTPVAVTRDGRYLAMSRIDGKIEVYRVADKR
jgi:WD40 repeat protein